MEPQLIRFIVDANAVLFSIILWMWALVALANNQKSGSKNKVVWVIWVLVVTLVPFTGPLIYLVTVAIKGRKVA